MPYQMGNAKTYIRTRKYMLRSKPQKLSITFSPTAQQNSINSFITFNIENNRYEIESLLLYQERYCEVCIHRFVHTTSKNYHAHTTKLYDTWNFTKVKLEFRHTRVEIYWLTD